MEPIKIGSNILNGDDIYDERSIDRGSGVFLISLVPTVVNRTYRAYKYLIGTDIDRLKHLINWNIHL